MISRSRGFTIVELLIVIVVIAVLAAITIVAFNGIQERAANAARLTEIRQIATLLDLYKAQFGDYPAMNTWTGYCIGGGYPDGVCRDPNGATAYPESNTTVTNELLKVGSLPSGPHKRITEWSAVGPYIQVDGDPNTFNLVGVFSSDDNVCPAPMVLEWKNPGNKPLWCHITFKRS